MVDKLPDRVSRSKVERMRLDTLKIEPLLAFIGIMIPPMTQSMPIDDVKDSITTTW